MTHHAFDAVSFAFHLPDDKAAALISRLSEAGNGRIHWLAENDDPQADSA